MARHRSLAVAAALSLAAAVVLTPASPAFAHTALSGTSPKAKSTVTKALTAVTLTFSGLIKTAGTAVVVAGPDGVSYSDGDAKAIDRKITQPVRPLPVGAITVRWQTVSSDGHPIEGSFTFTNTVDPPVAPTPTAEPTPTASPSPADAPSSAPSSGAASPVAMDPAADSGSPPVGFIIATAVLVAVALGGGLLWIRRRLKPPT